MYKLPSVAFAFFFCLIFVSIPLNSRQFPSLDRGNGRPWKVSRYLDNYMFLALQLREEKGIPLAITFAVAGIESDFGLSFLAQNSNNHFGIKIHDWEGPVYCHYTSEWMPEGGFLPVKACFRKYPLIADSYQDFGRFLSSRSNYRLLFSNPAWDYSSWAWQLQGSGYATDPNYAKKLLRVIEEYQLYLLDQ